MGRRVENRVLGRRRRSSGSWPIVRCAIVAYLLVAGCVRSDRTVPSDSTATREVGSVAVGGLLVRVRATKRTVHRDPCEQSFVNHRDCNDATIVTTVEAELDGRRLDVVAYDSGTDGSDRIVVAERDSRSFSRVDREADETLRSLRVVSCHDDTHLAFRVDTRRNPGWFNLLTLRHGVLLGVHVPDPEEQRCEVVLAAAQAADERLEREFREGNRWSFDVEARRGSLARALEFSLRHPLAIDSLREPLPTVDLAFLDRLEAEMRSNADFAALVVDRLAAPTSTFVPGPRGSRDLTGWLRELVARLPAESRNELSQRLVAICAWVDGCTDPQRGMLLEAVREASPEDRCPIASAAARAWPRTGDPSLEARLVEVARTYAGCEGSAEFASSILASSSTLAVRDEDFIYPPCLDLIGTNVAPRRCVSLPSLAVVLSEDDCEALLRDVAVAASSGRRPFEVGALAVYRRCGRIDDERALAGALRSSGRYGEGGVRVELDHSFPP